MCEQAVPAMDDVIGPVAPFDPEPRVAWNNGEIPLGPQLDRLAWVHPVGLAGVGVLAEDGNARGGLPIHAESDHFECAGAHRHISHGGSADPSGIDCAHSSGVRRFRQG